MSGDGVTYVGHATTLIEVDGTRLLTDPVLMARIGHIRRIAPPPPADLRADAVLISHAHHDHLDLRSLRRLPEDIPVLAPPGSAQIVRRWTRRRVIEAATGARVRLGSVDVHVTPAEHDGRRLPIGPELARGRLRGRGQLPRRVLRRHRRVRRHGQPFRRSRRCAAADLGLGAARRAGAHGPRARPRGPPRCCGRASRCRSTGARSPARACGGARTRPSPRAGSPSSSRLTRRTSPCASWRPGSASRSPGREAQLPRILAFCAANSSSVRMPWFLSSASCLSCSIGSAAGGGGGRGGLGLVLLLWFLGVPRPAATSGSPAGARRGC